jgi:hypothetical protein
MEEQKEKSEEQKAKCLRFELCFVKAWQFFM